MATVGVSMQLAAQSASAPSDGPVFQVASIKPNPTGRTGPTRSQVQPGGRLSSAENIPIRLLIGQAYQVPELPARWWSKLDRVREASTLMRKPTASYPRGRPAPVRCDGATSRTACRSLQARRPYGEREQLPIYTLVMARADGRLRPNPDPFFHHRLHSRAVRCARGARGGGPPPPPAPGGKAAPCGVMTGNGTFSADSRSVSQLAAIISAMVDRRVVDQTGLTGLFNAHLAWTPDQMPQQSNPNVPPIDPNGPSLFTAVQDQLGLKLQSTTGPVDVLVIDSVEKPTAD